jgi:hypothetical protein
MLGQCDSYFIQISKIELFVSFGVQFKLKYSRKSPKTLIIRHCDPVTLRIVRVRTFLMLTKKPISHEIKLIRIIKNL